MCKYRNIPLYIVLSVITCGIFAIYWFICLTDESNELVSSEDRTASGGMALVFTLLTCGIYGIYWSYKLGVKLDVIGATFGRPAKNQAFIFLILSIVGLGIINYALAQSELNNYAERYD